jgi:flagellar biosynthesis chaperone FliJ
MSEITAEIKRLKEMAQEHFKKRTEVCKNTARDLQEVISKVEATPEFQTSVTSAEFKQLFTSTFRAHVEHLEDFSRVYHILGTTSVGFLDNLEAFMVLRVTMEDLKKQINNVSGTRDKVEIIDQGLSVLKHQINNQMKRYEDVLSFLEEARKKAEQRQEDAKKMAEEQRKRLENGLDYVT